MINSGDLESRDGVDAPSYLVAFSHLCDAIDDISRNNNQRGWCIIFCEFSDEALIIRCCSGNNNERKLAVLVNGWRLERNYLHRSAGHGRDDLPLA